jgi:hypothetical protein
LKWPEKNWEIKRGKTKIEKILKLIKEERWYQEKERRKKRKKEDRCEKLR